MEIQGVKVVDKPHRTIPDMDKHQRHRHMDRAMELTILAMVRVSQVMASPLMPPMKVSKPMVVMDRHLNRQEAAEILHKKTSLETADHPISSPKIPLISKTMGKSQGHPMGNSRTKDPLNRQDMADNLILTPPGKRVLASPLRKMTVVITASMVVVVIEDMVALRVSVVAEVAVAMIQTDLPR
ncbi:unnamed protein product [Ranitomeya imitator]|uniref:Uncharacterized protein n=1 Tax=Ranitomeya imitator TaxID=111125 RepID=A0ABN9L0Q2_9NEOB|nr:unnamed protein product [Ranitomeya imitator]